MATPGEDRIGFLPSTSSLSQRALSNTGRPATRETAWSGRGWGARLQHKACFWQNEAYIHPYVLLTVYGMPTLHQALLGGSPITLFPATAVPRSERQR